MQNVDHYAEDDPFNARPRTPPRFTKLHEPGPSRQNRFLAEPPKLPSNLTPPVRRGSPLNPNKVNTPLEQRRRAWPPDASLGGHPDFPTRNRRNPSLSYGDMPRSDESTLGVKGGQEGRLDAGAFSNEYDLSHEDPRILQEVHRALQIKARREARLRRGSGNGPETSAPETSPPTSPKLQTPPRKNLPSRLPASPSFSPSPSRKLSNSTGSDVDFSPSTGHVDTPVQLHPVPTTLDSGLTLDWSGGHPEDGDKRWTKLPGRRKEREKLPPLGVMLDQQEHAYKGKHLSTLQYAPPLTRSTEKLARINGVASSQTIRKARMIGDQLGRQYDLIYSSLEPNRQVINLAEAARWYNAQDSKFKDFVTSSQPFTWLKHLKRQDGRTDRNPWDLSALILEEYVSTHLTMRPIPEDSTLPDFPAARVPSLPSPQRLPLPKGFHSQATANPLDEKISFEPLSDSKRASFDAMSRKSAESALSSIQSGSSQLPSSSLPPLLNQINDLKDDLLKPVVTTLLPDTPQLTASPPAPSSDSGTIVVPQLLVQAPSDGTTLSLPPTISVTQSGSTGSSSSNNPPPSSPTHQSFGSLRNSEKSRSLRTALPPYTRRVVQRKRPSPEAREAQLRKEYEEKARLLHDAEGHNSRMRILLSRMATTIKEYDSIQATTFHSLGIVQPRLPRELVEAFGHDPAAVIGPTRRLRDWRAVEDIHQRIVKQRQVVQAFLNSHREPQADDQCFLDDTITDILQALKYLEHCKERLEAQTTTVKTQLKEVQAMHAGVKENFNKAVATVSVVYPQLSLITALEESYRDQYQHFWDIGMDAITLLFDTVTPFWRTYGKTIGEDIRDFLIIPLYRNEFTGEAKKYPIKGLPQRSLRHWFGLVVFFVLSICVNILQLRAAISSSLHFRLLAIPYEGVRWTALPIFWLGIIVQWLAVIFEFAIVFTQIGSIAWWIGWSVKVFT